MRALRIFFLSLLLAFIGLILYFVFRPRETVGARFRPVSGKSFQLRFQYTEMSGKKVKYTAIADQYLVDSRNFTHLLGNIKITIYTSDTVITAEQCTINPARTRYEFKGKVFLQGKGEEMSTEDAIYMPKKDVVLVRSSLQFKRGKMEGRAARGRFLLKEKLAIFINPVFKIGEVSIVGARLELHNSENVGFLKGRPAGIYLSSRTLHGPLLKFFLREGEIEKVEAVKGGRLSLGEGEGFLLAKWYEVVIDKGIKAKNTFIVKDDLNLKADQVSIEDRTKVIRAEGNLLIKGKNFRVRASSGEIEKERMLLQGEVVITKKDMKIEASSAEISRDGRKLSMEEARYVSGDLSLAASTIDVDGEDVEASGKVEGKKGDTVFKCKRLIRRDGKEFLEGKVRIVKQGNLIKGRKATIEGKTFSISDGSISTGEGYRVKGKKIIYVGDRIEVLEGASIKGEELSLLASRAVLYLKEGKLEKLEAEEVKELNLRDSTGEANFLDYDFSKKIAILKGHAKIDSPTEGVLKGEKIIFYVDEGRFEVTGRGRTSSRIKGEK